MKPIHAAYTQEVYANLRPLHATWEPTQPVILGDVGLLQGRVFRHQTNLKSLGIEFSERRGNARPNLWFGSHGTTELQVKPEIRGAPGLIPQRASVELHFSSGGATFFHAAQCESVIIEDAVLLRGQVLDLFRHRKWDQNWVVISEAILSASTTIAVAGRSGATLRLEAKASPPTIELMDVALRFELSSVSRVDYQLISTAGLAPLIGLSKLQRPWFREPEFGPALTAPGEEPGEWEFKQIQ